MQLHHLIAFQKHLMGVVSDIWGMHNHNSRVSEVEFGWRINHSNVYILKSNIMLNVTKMATCFRT